MKKSATKNTKKIVTKKKVSTAKAITKKSAAKKTPKTFSDSAWKTETLNEIRSLIFEAAPDAKEELKWRGVPVWSLDGIICTGETYKEIVKTTFMKGASLKDPSKLFNSSLEGNARRAIDFHEGEIINAKAFKALVKEAVALNQSKK